MWQGPFPRLRRGAVGLASLAILLPTGVFALHYPLQPEEIEEAYSLGQSGDREELANFFKPYEHDFAYPSDNPIVYVKSIELQTPFEQIVLKSMRSARYDKFNAEEDYRASAGAVLVRVVVALKIGFAGPIPKAESYQVSVSQGNPIHPRETTSNVLCNPFDPLAIYTTPQPCGDTYTREILLRFDRRQFGPATVTVKALLPDQRSLETVFNLDRLK